MDFTFYTRTMLNAMMKVLFWHKQTTEIILYLAYVMKIFLLRGLPIIASIVYKTKCPPSSIGIGNKFITSSLRGTRPLTISPSKSSFLLYSKPEKFSLEITMAKQMKKNIIC